MAQATDGGSAVEFQTLEVTQDAVDRKKEEMRAAYRASGGRSFDRTEVLNKQPGYSYRGVNMKPQQGNRVAEFEAEGWEPVPEKDPEVWRGQNRVEDGVKMLGSEQGLFRIRNEKRIENLALVQLKQEMVEGQFIDATRQKMEEMVREAIPRMGRDVTFDDSKQGPTVEKVVPRRKEVP
jgi:hypothetical protein